MSDTCPIGLVSLSLSLSLKLRVYKITNCDRGEIVQRFLILDINQSDNSTRYRDAVMSRKVET